MKFLFYFDWIIYLNSAEQNRHHDTFKNIPFCRTWTKYYRILRHLDQLNLPLVDPPRVVFSHECVGWDVLWTLSLVKVKIKHILIELKIWGLAQKGNKFSIIQEQQHSTHYFSCNECLSSSTTWGIFSSYFNVEQTFVVYLAMYRFCLSSQPLFYCWCDMAPLCVQTASKLEAFESEAFSSWSKHASILQWCNKDFLRSPLVERTWNYIKRWPEGTYFYIW